MRVGPGHRLSVHRDQERARRTLSFRRRRDIGKLHRRFVAAPDRAVLAQRRREGGTLVWIGHIGRRRGMKDDDGGAGRRRCQQRCQVARQITLADAHRVAPQHRDGVAEAGQAIRLVGSDQRLEPSDGVGIASQDGFKVESHAPGDPWRVTVASALIAKLFSRRLSLPRPGTRWRQWCGTRARTQRNSAPGTARPPCWTATSRHSRAPAPCSARPSHRIARSP